MVLEVVWGPPLPVLPLSVVTMSMVADVLKVEGGANVKPSRALLIFSRRPTNVTVVVPSPVISTLSGVAPKVKVPVLAVNVT